MKKIILVTVLIMACIFSASGCSDGKGPNGQDPDLKYDEKYLSPSYHEVDESGYTVYYFDSANGSDAADGKSQQTAKKTVEEANRIVAGLAEDYTPTKLLFKRGASFTDVVFNLSGYAAPKDKPLIADAYGDGTDYPEFAANGQPYTVYLTSSNTRINNLGISNSTGKTGITVRANDGGALENVVIEGCYIHDVNWRWNRPENSDEIPLNIDEVRGIVSDADFNYSNGGIIFDTHSVSKNQPAWYQDVWIVGNTVRRVARSGMFLTTQWARRPGMDWGVNKYSDEETGFYPSRRVVIKDNFVTHTGGDGIVLLGSRNSFIEGNTSYHANYLGRSGFYNAGIWPHSCVDLVIQYNEAAYARLDNGGGDGEGFDIDVGCENIYFQYNYSHHNAGGGLLLCNTGSEQFTFHDAEGNVTRRETVVPAWKNVYVRNNVFVNNGKKGHPSMLVLSSYMTDIYVENNTVIMPKGQISQDLLLIDDFTNKYGIAERLFFRNNIFAAPKDSFAGMDVLKSNQYLFENNLFYNFSESDLNAANVFDQLNFDPQITLPQTFDGYENFASFKAENPLVYQKGILLEKMAKYDIAGNDVTDIKYIGAFGK